MTVTYAHLEVSILTSEEEKHLAELSDLLDLPFRVIATEIDHILVDIDLGSEKLRVALPRKALNQPGTSNILARYIRQKRYE